MATERTWRASSPATTWTPARAPALRLREPAGKVCGIAPGARLVNVKVGDGNGVTDVSQVLAAIDWVVQHAHDPKGPAARR